MITTAPSYSDWQNWNLHQNWWFYKPLLLTYSPWYIGRTLVLWKKRSTPLSPGAIAEGGGGEKCSITNFGSSAEIEAFGLKPFSVYDATLSVDAKRNGSFLFRQRLLVVVSTPSRLNHLKGMYSLPPYAVRVNIPVITNRNGGSLQRIEVQPNGQATVVIRDCRLSGISRLNASFFDLEGFGASVIVAHNLTDENWVNGIGRRWAGFLVENNSENRGLLEGVDAIGFPKSGEREVKRIEDRGRWINVYVEGMLLDPEQDGFPHQALILRGPDRDSIGVKERD